MRESVFLFLDIQNELMRSIKGSVSFSDKAVISSGSLYSGSIIRNTDRGCEETNITVVAMQHKLQQQLASYTH